MPVAAICPQYGAPLPAGARSCPYCRVQFTAPASGSKTPSPALVHAVNEGEIPEVPEGWQAYSNPWIGFSLALPPLWKVVCNQGAINVREDSGGFVSVSLQAVQLQGPMTAADFSQTWITNMRSALPDFSATQVTESIQDANQVTLRVQAHYLGAPLVGKYHLKVNNQEAFISGFQCPIERSDTLLSTFETIQSSYQPIEKMARQVHQEASENAFSVWIPNGWIAKSSVNRNNMGGAAFINLDVVRDNSNLVRAAVPWISWMFHEGMASMWGAPAAMQNLAYIPAVQLCQAVVMPWLSHYHQNLHLEGVIDRPDMVPFMANEFMKGGTNPQMFDLSAAMMMITYVENNTSLRQVCRILAQHPKNAMPFPNPLNPLGGGTWNAFMDSFYRAPQEEFDELEPVLTGILDTVVVNPTWQQAQRMRNNYWPG